MTDREIREALAVDPSPEFAARVRARIATEPAPADRRVAWWLAAAAIAAAVIVAVVLWRPARPAQAPALLAARSTTGITPFHVVQGFSPAHSLSSPHWNVRLKPDATSASVPYGASGVSRTFVPSNEPEVLLDPLETRALRALIAGVRAGRIDLTPSTQATTPSVMDLEPIQDLAIAPLVIAPVEGVRQ